MSLSNTFLSHTLVIIFTLFLTNSVVISCNTNNAPCPPALTGAPELPFPPFLPTFPPVVPRGTPLLPQTPYVPETPTVPETPQTPTLPYLPVPQTPTVPERPDTPTLPYVPQTPMVPETPQTPTLPYLPLPPILPTPTLPKENNKNVCPRDVLKLGVCGDMLGRSIGQTIGSPPSMPCCQILSGLFDFEVAVCLCTAIKANVLGTVFDFPIAINNVFNNCQKDNKSGFQCE